MTLPKKIGLYGLGEVVLEYFYPSLQSLEDKKIIEITSIIGRGNLEERIKKIETRAKRYPLERCSAEDIIKRLKEKNSKHIEYIENNGENLPSNLKSYTDFVYLATPTNIRIEPIKQLANAGVAIVIEKPLGRTRGELNEAVDIIRRYNIKAICAEHYSYKAPSLKLFEEFDYKTKDFRKINSIEGVLEENDFLDAERYEWLLDSSINGGGAWIDIGVHMMHLVYMMGAKMTNIISSKSYKYSFPSGNKKNNIIKSETATDAFFNIEGNDGRINSNAYAHIKVGKCMPESQKYFKVCFEKGEIFIDFEKNSLSYTDRTGPNIIFKEEMFSNTKSYSNMIFSFVNYLNDSSKVPPTTMSLIKESTDAVFRVYSEMKEEDARQYY